MSSKDDSSNATASPSKFAFRPSKLASVTEKIWKKDLPSSETTKKPEETVLKLVDKAIFTSSSATTKTISEVTSSNNFIFGQNIRERVAIQNQNVVNLDDNDKKQQSTSWSTTTTENMKFKDFKDVTKDENSATKNGDSKSKNLEESAKTYEQNKLLANKVQLAENVDVKTGEEDDQNILQVNCKLHIFDHDKNSWEERGGAIFRFNECFNKPDESFDECNYRIVIRLNGNLRLVVNSRLFSEMLLEKISPKRLKFSVIDFEKDNKVVICLITANQSDIDRIENLIHSKFSDLKSQSSSNKRKIDDEREENDEKSLDKKLKAE